MKTLEPSPLFDFSPHLEGYSEPYVFGVGTDGSLFCSAAKMEVSKRFDSSAPHTNTFGEPTDYIVLSWNGSELRSTILSDEALVVDFIQPHQLGILLVAERCQWFSDGAEKNALIIDWEGKVVSRFVIGDGITDIRTTPTGNIFVGFDDAGIYGDWGWSGPGPEPLGSGGLVGLDSEGNELRDFNFTGAIRKTVDDVWAMNVTDDNVWLHFQSDKNQIVNIHAGRSRSWKCEFSDARGPATDGNIGLAINGDRVLLVGYELFEMPSRIVQLRSLHRSSTVETVAFPDAEKADWHHVWCVGDQVFVFREGKVSVLREW